MVLVLNLNLEVKPVPPVGVNIVGIALWRTGSVTLAEVGLTIQI